MGAILGLGYIYPEPRPEQANPCSQLGKPRVVRYEP